MYAARAAKPKLSLSISATQNTLSLPLKSPVTATPLTPISPAAASASPSTRRFSSFQQPPPAGPYTYSNPCSSKSILKKHHGGARPSSHAADSKRIQFKGTPTVYCVTPIENPEEYYGSHHKVSRDERRWMRRE